MKQIYGLKDCVYKVGELVNRFTDLKGKDVKDEKKLAIVSKMIFKKLEECIDLLDILEESENK